MTTSSNTGSGLVTISMLSWKRPENVRLILSLLVEYSIVQRIYVYHQPGSGVPPPSAGHPKVVIRETERNDMRNRWRVAFEEDVTDCILLQDDDLIPSRVAIEFLYRQWFAAPQRLHTMIGRNIGRGHSYNFESQFGEVDIAMHSPLAVHRRYVTGAYQEAQRSPNADIVASHAEDMWLSFWTTSQTGKKHRSHRPQEGFLEQAPHHNDGLGGQSDWHSRRQDALRLLYAELLSS